MLIKTREKPGKDFERKTTAKNSKAFEINDTLIYLFVIVLSLLEKVITMAIYFRKKEKKQKKPQKPLYTYERQKHHDARICVPYIIRGACLGASLCKDILIMPS